MKKIINFLFESGQLKRVKRSGWWTIGIKDPESVAEHSFRAAIVGYFLAKKEKVNEEKVIKMCLFQDIPETRINDLHKIGQRYVEQKKAEKNAFKEQLETIPKEFSDELEKLFKEFQDDGSKEGIVARDADYIECALQAKEYMDIGYYATNWIKNIESCLKTKSAKELMEEIKKTDSLDWWEGLKKIER